MPAVTLTSFLEGKTPAGATTVSGSATVTVPSAGGGGRKRRLVNMRPRRRGPASTAAPPQELDSGSGSVTTGAATVYGTAQVGVVGSGAVTISVTLDAKAWTLYEPPGYLAALAYLDPDVAELVRRKHEAIKVKARPA